MDLRLLAVYFSVLKSNSSSVMTLLTIVKSLMRVQGQDSGPELRISVKISKQDCRVTFIWLNVIDLV